MLLRYANKTKGKKYLDSYGKSKTDRQNISRTAGRVR